jgi:hypothetical protein
MQSDKGEIEVKAFAVSERFLAFSDLPRQGIANCYVRADDRDLRRLRAVFEHGDTVCWIELPRPQMKESRSLFLHLWNALIMWIESLLPKVIDADDGRWPKFLQIFVSPEEPFVADPHATPKQEHLQVIAISNTTVMTVFPSGFVTEFFGPDNSGEKKMMDEMLRGIAMAFSADSVSSQLKNIIEDAFRDSGARSMHFGERFDVRSKIQSATGRRSPIRAAQESLRAAQVGLAFAVDPRVAPGLLHGEKAKGFLNAAAQRVRSLIRDRLVTLNARDAIERLLENIEQIEADRWQWRVSSRALIALHESIDDILLAASKHESENAKSSLGSAIIIEMANCDCQRSGGLKPTVTDIRVLLGLAALLIEMGYHSDAIYCELTDETLRIFPSGEIESEMHFWDEVVVPFRKGIFKTSFMKAADSYERIIASHAGDSGIELDSEFEDAVRAEVGMSIQECWLVIEAMGDLASKARRAVVCAPEPETVIELSNSTDIDREKIRHFICALSLYHRAVYEQPPIGYQNSDIHPWRFNRRLSFVRRPIVRPDFETESVSRLIFSPGAVEHSFKHFLSRFFCGEYDRRFFDSREARSWIDYATRSSSLEFENTVAAVFRNKTCTTA